MWDSDTEFNKESWSKGKDISIDRKAFFKGKKGEERKRYIIIIAIFPRAAAVMNTRMV